MAIAVHVAMGRVSELAHVAQSHAAGWLSPAERARLERLTATGRRMQFLAGRWMARQMLAAIHGNAPDEWRLSAPDNGPPSASGPGGMGQFVSLSHCGDRIACAIATCAIGLDLEVALRPRDFLRMADAICTPAETIRIREAQPCETPRRFYECWTLKEAWLKSRGEDISPGRLALISTEPSDDEDCGTGRLWQAGDLVLALVAPPGSTVCWLGHALPRPGRWRITDAAAPQA